MAIPDFGEKWRQNLQPASFRGCGFKVDTGSFAGGQRLVAFEFPKSDIGFTEFLGRRLRRFHITGYIVQSSLAPDSPSGTGGTDYQMVRDALIGALEADGAANLQHPTLGTFSVMCEHYQVIENKNKGGMATFEMEFVEAGSQASPTLNTTTQVSTAAQAALTTINTSVANTPGTTIGTNGFGLSGVQAATSPFGAIN